MSRLLFLCLLLAAPLGFAQNPAPETYESLLNKGLKAEALRQYADAITFYVGAYRISPQSIVVNERLTAIFTEIKANGGETREFEILLPPNLRDEFLKSGVLKTSRDDAAFLKKMTLIFWVVAGLVVLGILMGLIWLIKRRGQEPVEEKKFSTNVSPTRKVAARASSGPKKEVKITEKTREDISGIMETGHKSITSAQPRPDLSKVPEELGSAIQDSEVVQALAGTMLTEVSTEQTETGKFSKLSIEAGLVFEDADLEDLKEKK